VPQRGVHQRAADEPRAAEDEEPQRSRSASSSPSTSSAVL
jgi:hypothetical protein